MGKIVLNAAAALTAMLSAAAGASSGPLSQQDALWLERVTYGPTTATVDEYLKLGRRRFLDAQLHARDQRLPTEIAHAIDALEISHLTAPQLLLGVTKEQQRINALPDEAARQADRKALNEQGNHMAYEAARQLHM